MCVCVVFVLFITQTTEMHKSLPEGGMIFLWFRRMDGCYILQLVLGMRQQTWVEFTD